VFVGTVGPALMLTADDAVRLHLEKWEVPGTASFFSGAIPCRRVLVDAHVPALEAKATLVACYPTVARDVLVKWQRGRDMFWQWGGGLLQMTLARVPPDDWVVFGNDRVLGHGKTPEEAVAAADEETEFAYHRFCFRLRDLPPAMITVGGSLPDPITFDLRKSTTTSVTLNGHRVAARVFARDPPVYVVPSEDAPALRLELAESPFRFRLVEEDYPKPPARYARAGRAWTDLPVTSDAKPAGTRRALVLVLYERPKEPSDDPIEWPPGLDAPAMR
jgi:hypothetical protein